MLTLLGYRYGDGFGAQGDHMTHRLLKFRTNFDELYVILNGKVAIVTNPINLLDQLSEDSQWLHGFETALQLSGISIERRGSFEHCIPASWSMADGEAWLTVYPDGSPIENLDDWLPIPAPLQMLWDMLKEEE
jgi:hypothetical protein